MNLRKSLLLLFFFFRIHVSMAIDTISPGQSLSGNQTIISNAGNFELGFFTPGKSRNYYIGIWLEKDSGRTPVWIANREKPLPDTSSELKLDSDGNLVLVNRSNILIWSSNADSISSNSTFAVLLDTGNFVLRDGSNSSVVIWQSFDHLTDTLLPGGWLGLNKITGLRQRLISWRNSYNPAPGTFSLQIEQNGTGQYFMLWNDSQRYWISGVWNGHMFSYVPEMTLRGTGYMIALYNFSYVSNDKEHYFTYSFKDGSTIARAIMDTTGQIKVFMWLKDAKRWNLFWSQPIDQCVVYARCGAFGICNENTSPSCSCLEGFRPRFLKDWNMNDWSGGCIREMSLNCGRNDSLEREAEDVFLKIPKMRLPVNSLSMTVGNAKECKLACLNICSCNAYAYRDGCSIWRGNLLNLHQLSSGSTTGEDLYLRLTPGAISRSKKGMVSGTILGAVLGIAAILGIVVVIIWRCRRKKQIGVLKGDECSLVSFRYRDLQHLTNNFSEKLGGGSFGSVFKGTWPDSNAIAVKKLEGLRQGEKQFRSEVSTIGVIQHINLVRLRGFCSEGTKKLLVYDYMPNGSLDSHLFQKDSVTLDWKTRHQIALGTARGLAYLHEKCRDCIIHCDIKPENILLDDTFCPKVADFGLAKLVGREFSRVLTTTRGTIGYLAPEWILGLAITPKADVYSYGMMLFEIISGNRNTKQCEDENMSFFPVWAASKVNQGELFGLLDHRLEGCCNMEELGRLCKVACWCIQDAEDSRPSMGQVVQILEGVLRVSVPPVPALLKRLLDEQDPVVLSKLSLDQSYHRPQKNVPSSFQCSPIATSLEN